MLLSDVITVIDSVEEVAIEYGMTDIITRLDLIHADFVMIGNGLHILIYVAVGFFVWKVVAILWHLFNGWFFGGL